MSGAVEPLLILVLATDLFFLGGSRIGALIRLSALQGVLLALLPALVHPPTGHVWVIVIGTAVVKGIVLPRLLRHALLSVGVRREIEPIVGFAPSMLLGLVALGGSLWIGRRLQLPHELVSPLLVPTSFFTIMAGLLLVLCRRKALTQVLGYLVFENGIFAFGVAVVHDQPVLVEMGVLLDLFVAVFVMGIMVFHINREFGSIDISRMRNLRDSTVRLDREDLR